MASIELEGLTKKFGQVTAVRDVNLKVNDGEFICLLGPSGCGKTTTLLMISGIYRPSGGDIYFDNTKVNDVAPRDRHVGLVFQSYALYPHMSVYDNIAFPLRLEKVSKGEIEERVKGVANLVNLEELLERKPSQLSGGQQQRVALCRALVKEPSVLLLDEPLSNLDARLRIETRAEIKKLQQRLKITTVHVTHDQEEALSMAERIAVLDQGVLQQFTNPNKLYRKPKNLFVASFIGDPPMNLVPISCCQREKGKHMLTSREFDLEITEEQIASEIKEDLQELMLGIRPEDIQLKALEETEEGFVGEVFLTEPFGRDQLVDFRFGDSTFRVLVSQNETFNAGDKCRIVLDLDRLHLFDKKTGRSLLR